MQRELRLTGSKRISLIHQEGRRWANRLLVLRAIPNDLDKSRFGFVVGKRVGHAVIRNKLKRRLREIARVQPVRSGWDSILIARRETSTADYYQLKQALEVLLHRAGLMETPANSLPMEVTHRASPPSALGSTRRADSREGFAVSGNPKGTEK